MRQKKEEKSNQRKFDIMKSKIFKYQGNDVVFKKDNGNVMVNVTQFAKAFPDKNLSTIINSDEIRNYVRVLAEIKNFSSADLLRVTKG